MHGATRRTVQAGAACFLAWTVAGLFFCSQSIAQKLASNDPTPAWHHVVSWMTGVYVWAALTPAVLWLGRRFPIERARWVRRGATHLGLGVALAVVQLACEAAILRSVGVFPAIFTSFPAAFAFLVVIGLHQAIATYWIVLGAQAAIGWYQRFQERAREALRLELRASALETELARAQLGALKMQLQPHFLFNTLNAIMVLVRAEKGQEAETMLARLSDLLRCVLDDVAEQEVPLQRELEYLRLYLSIEQVRFQDRLRVEITADAATLDAAVPQMGLQPIVENAIRHGIGRSSAAGSVRVRASRHGGALRVRVEDDGPGFPRGDVLRTGIGLSNTGARLRQLYGDGAGLALENGERGAVVTMTLPYRLLSARAGEEVMEVHERNDADRG